MNLVGAYLALDSELPPVRDVREFWTALGGLYARADDARIAALVPVALSGTPLTGLAMLDPFARLRVNKIPESFLKAMLASARRAMPVEAIYQLVYVGLGAKDPSGWHCWRPNTRSASPGHVTFEDTVDATVDLHSHHTMRPFFSGTDDADEQGLRFYCVIGRLDTDQPQIAARVGVYGHTMRVPATVIFTGLGSFVDTYGCCRECGCTDGQACPGGCYWVEEDLCSSCADKEEGESVP